MQQSSISSQTLVSELVHNTLPMTPSVVPSGQRPRLPYPVVIPQRRPGTKTRGFARVYPPDLNSLGIDQDTFLRLLKNFQTASQASPWLHALFISAGVVGLVPGAITLAVSISVQVAAGVAIEVQGRYKANAFLDEMNKELFMPLGLYAMVLAYKPDGPGTTTAPAFGMQTINFETAKQISKWGLPNSDGEEAQEPTKFFRPLHSKSGKTKGEAMVPFEVAPLIYPGLDRMAERPSAASNMHPDSSRNEPQTESFKARVARNKKFVADYFDRRAAATYAGNNPDTILAKSTAQTSFRSRYADPNHPVNNGTPLSFLTGGKLGAAPPGMYGTRETGEDGRLKPMARPSDQRLMDVVNEQGPLGLVGYGVDSVKKKLEKDVLYLTIVNMPSPEELAEAKRVLEMDKRGLKELLGAFGERRGERL
ncbi:hypothetical protein K505DRAFT_270583 [Melanomma pulvis-pyrius CBS 109.77]|uniref:Uncharacterized protein n=1 Tax=Melanomma pulvis-pyrius CBS 109.77 TaxID=1314802 RepID=A0A6A6XLB4_9PLEO|nr:hypothetical protein K505DRAFT_270583 [Melanomma pulvis-pyrius CBS 109.77]